MRFLVPMLIPLAVACGAGPSKTQDASVAGKTTPTAPEDPDGAPKVAPTTPGAPEAIYAVSLDNVKELPECSPKTNLKQLAYVKADSQFYSCESTGWSALTIGTAPGAKGDKGDIGAAGKDGQVVVLPTNLWLDAVTGSTWLIGGLTGVPTGVCTDGYTLGTPTQLQTAISHGLNAKTASALLWTTISLVGAPGSGIPELVDGSNGVERFNQVVAAPMIVCLKI